jgi:hypothetical protein
MKIGDRLHDNDPRMKSRTLTITACGVRTEHGLLDVRAKDRSGREFSILVRRIHSDGKPRRGGFDLEVV